MTRLLHLACEPKCIREFITCQCYVVKQRMEDEKLIRQLEEKYERDVIKVVRDKHRSKVNRDY